MRASRIGGGVILAGFLLGAGLSTSPFGVAVLWLTVIAGYAWIPATSVYLYRTVPHPDVHRRAAARPA